MSGDVREALSRNGQNLRYLVVSGWNFTFGAAVYIVLVTEFGRQYYWC